MKQKQDPKGVKKEKERNTPVRRRRRGFAHPQGLRLTNQAYTSHHQKKNVPPPPHYADQMRRHQEEFQLAYTAATGAADYECCRVLCSRQGTVNPTSTTSGISPRLHCTRPLHQSVAQQTTSRSNNAELGSLSPRRLLARPNSDALGHVGKNKTR